MDYGQGYEGHRNLSHTFNVQVPGAHGGGAELGRPFGGKLSVVHLVQYGDGEGHRSSGGRVFGGTSLFAGGCSGVLDARSDEPYDSFADSLAGLVDLAHRKLALVELAVLELGPDGAVDDVFDALWGRFLERLHGRLDRVGEHQDPGLLALRAGAGVAEVRLVDGGAGREGLFEGLAVEVFDASRAVVFGDHAQDLGGQVPLAPELDAVLHVALDDAGGEGGGEGRVRVHARDLVLDKVVGVFEFADVVVVSAYAGEQRVGPDALGGVRGEAADLHGVGKGPWRPAEELLQEGIAGVGEFEELHGREDVEDVLEKREEDHREHQGEKAVR